MKTPIVQDPKREVVYQQYRDEQHQFNPRKLGYDDPNLQMGIDYGGNEVRTIGAAAKALITAEFAYGGQVVHLTETKIVVMTRVMSKIDHVVITGTHEAMLPLFGVIATYMTISGLADGTEAHVQEQVKILDSIREQGGEWSEKIMRPLYLVHAFPILAGERFSRGTMAALLSETQEDVRLFLKGDNELLGELIRYKLDDQMPIEELRSFMQ